ncbi:MAG: hypothetical protein GX117_06800, partial [Candidatus Hydrogenedentes bacterium]|nr:hypothetical protein [Candidatus Hydrogenedentota bacterium]
MFYLMRAILIVAALIIPGILAAQDISPVADNKAEQVETQPLLTADQILTELNAQIKEQYTGKLDSVTPDALVKIKHGEETTTLRLYGIDCPEIGQAFAEEARDELKKRYQGDTVAVYVLTVDSLNVPVALVFDENSHSISHSLAVDGLAWWDEHNASKDTVLRKLNAEAVLAERAVFSEITALAPWDYRSSHDLPNFTYSLEQQAATPVKPLHAAPEDAAPRTISAKGTMTESAPKVGARPKQAPSSGSPRLSLPNVP